MYGLESEANRLDNELVSTKHNGFKCISCKKSNSQQRVAAMHYNDMINIKTRYETLFDVNVEDETKFENKPWKLKDLLLNQKVNDSKLFTAVEQGAGKAFQNVHIMLNPKVKNIAIKWIVNNYNKIEFKFESEHKTSIDVTKHQKDVEHNEDLREFLAPVLQSKEATQMKKYGRKIKTYAQAIGLKCDETKDATKSTQTIEKNTYGSVHSNNAKKNRELENTIKEMNEQILKLKQIIETLCEAIQDEKVKNQVEESLNKLKSPTQPEKIEEINNEKIDQGKESMGHLCSRRSTKLTVLNRESEKNLKIKGKSGKRKEHPLSLSYNSNADDKAGTLCNNYYKVGLEAMNRRKMMHLGTNE